MLTKSPTKPGHYLDLPNDLYHAGPGVSKSKLDLVAMAPALLEWSRNAPRDEDAKAAVDLGDALHAITLEPDRFDREYVADFRAPPGTISSIDEIKMAMDRASPPIEYLSKDTRPALVRKLLEGYPDAPLADRLRDEWARETIGKTILSHEEHRKLRLMHASAMAHPDARALLQAPGVVESSIYWKDPETGLLCRCRPDKLLAIGGRRIAVDVKSTADMDRFAASIEDYRYHVQDAHYRNGFEAHFGQPPDGFVFLAVSTQRDAGRYPVRCFQLEPEDRAQGQHDLAHDLAVYAECQRTGIWSGIETIRRPEWARRRDVAVAA